MGIMEIIKVYMTIFTCLFCFVERLFIHFFIISNFSNSYFYINIV